MKDEPYKVELINDLPEDSVISFYKQEGFTDPVSYTHLDVYKRQGQFVEPHAVNRAEILHIVAASARFDGRLRNHQAGASAVGKDEMCIRDRLYTVMPYLAEHLSKKRSGRV